MAERPERREQMVRLARRVALSAFTSALALWIALAVALAQITGRVVDWFTMTDELLYERFAISFANGDFPLPHIRGHASPTYAELYPLLIAPFFRHGLIPHDLHGAHIANAWIMSSAVCRRSCLPAV